MILSILDTPKHMEGEQAILDTVRTVTDAMFGIHFGRRFYHEGHNTISTAYCLEVRKFARNQRIYLVLYRDQFYNASEYVRKASEHVGRWRGCVGDEQYKQSDPFINQMMADIEAGKLKPVKVDDKEAIEKAMD